MSAFAAVIMAEREKVFLEEKKESHLTWHWRLWFIEHTFPLNGQTQFCNKTKGRVRHIKWIESYEQFWEKLLEWTKKWNTNETEQTRESRIVYFFPENSITRQQKK